MANNNKALSAAGQAKKDEFYTQLVDIENELRHYKENFKGKGVFCNCDDRFEIIFFKYFDMNFNYLGLKKLITTCYATSPVIYTQLSLFDEPEVVAVEQKGKPYKVILTEVTDHNGDGRIDLSDVEHILKHDKDVLSLLQGDGDFRSQECIDLLKESDVVVTNPPFSLFREYVSQLMEYQKDFIIIGNQNAVTYKEFFPLIIQGKIWYGASIHSHGRDFMVPDDYPLKAYEYRTDEQGRKFINIKGVRWFTNIDYKERHEKLILYKRYNPEEYPHYDNYDAIEVAKTADIPLDYQGIMGVPISFMDKYNPEQFEIIGLDRYTVPKQFLVGGRVAVNGKPKYARILIRNKEVNI